MYRVNVLASCAQPVMYLSGQDAAQTLKDVSAAEIWSHDFMNKRQGLYPWARKFWPLCGLIDFI